MNDVRIAAQINHNRDETCADAFKASVPMSLIFERGFDADWLQKNLAEFEKEYDGVVRSLGMALISRAVPCAAAAFSTASISTADSSRSRSSLPVGWATTSTRGFSMALISRAVIFSLS